MYYHRDLSNVLPRYVKFPVIAILGPRQSGKTTLAKHYFHQHKYINLELPEYRAFAAEDPTRFLREFDNPHGIIIDEFQYVPALLSYIQAHVDAHPRKGYFILTGSQNFLVDQSITQSLAGRVGILTLLPLSLHELCQNTLLQDIDHTLLNGSYPRLFQDQIAAIDFYSSYIYTYLERDVRQLAHVGDILTFQKLMRLCAARIGQQLNLAELATQLGLDQRKVRQWVSVLESSYIIFLLKPHFENFNKRITKTPKLYFYDSGLACSLLNIKTTQTLSLSPFRGNLFESLIISDFHKQYYNNGIGHPSLYYWRDQNGRIEVDCLIDTGNTIIPVEIKSSETINSSYFSALSGWLKLSGNAAEHAAVIYGGDKNQGRSQGRIISWLNATQFILQSFDILGAV